METKEKISKAICELKASRPIGIPTETVYGLGAPVDDIISIKKVFELKERPLYDPLIVHVSSTLMAQKYVEKWEKAAQLLAQNFWPGPLTIIQKRGHHIDPLITAGLQGVGIRMPRHPLTLKLIEKLNTALAAPSANKFKKTSPTLPEHVFESFGPEVFVLDGGPCEVGLESTVVEVINDEVLIYRPGMITQEMIEKVLGPQYKVSYQKGPVSPGQLDVHYRPEIPLILLDKNQSFDINQLPKDMQFQKNQYDTLILNDNPFVAARELYSKLQGLRSSNSKACILKFNSQLSHQEWMAPKDRLFKAATINLIPS